MNPGDPQLPITSDDVAEAARRLSGVANRTPVFTSRELNERVEAQLFLKAEHFQRGGAFKFRGAYNAVSSLSEQLRSPGDLPFAVVKALGEDVVSVDDEQMLTAMRYLFERQKLVTEPSGSSAVAAVMAGLIDVKGLRVGGNTAVGRFVSLMSDDR